MKRKLWTSAILLIASVASAQVIESIPMSPRERALTEITKVFDFEAVGNASAKFVDPVAACVRMYSSKVIIGGVVNCKLLRMGSQGNEEERGEEPQHLVELTKPFEIQATEVTQLQWLMVMKDSERPAPAEFRNCVDDDYGQYRIEKSDGTLETLTVCRNHPVEQVSYDDITGQDGFLARLNASQTKYTYRLPTEAEWEYAIRGGQLKADGSYPRYFFGDDAFELGLYAQYDQNSLKQPHSVAQKKPNPYGLYDMGGNVWEIVADFYDSSYGLESDQLAQKTQDPLSLSASTSRRAVRGGSWANEKGVLRSASRSYIEDSTRDTGIGFRLVRVRR